MSSIEKSVIDKIIKRSELGEKKYNTTMDRNDLSEIDWLVHLQEEHVQKLIEIKKVNKNENADGYCKLADYLSDKYGGY